MGKVNMASATEILHHFILLYGFHSAKDFVALIY